jgi:peptidoglycan hydrolase-like protein with peptidoglycan-binding domain
MSMKKGDRGDGVAELQRRLDAWIKHKKPAGLIGVIDDGAYGQNTTVAVASFQKAAGLSPTGYADASTLAELDLPDLDPAGTITTEGGGI